MNSPADGASFVTTSRASAASAYAFIDSSPLPRASAPQVKTGQEDDDETATLQKQVAMLKHQLKTVGAEPVECVTLEVSPLLAFITIIHHHRHHDRFSSSFAMMIIILHLSSFITIVHLHHHHHLAVSLSPYSGPTLHTSSIFHRP